ncbi:MAG: hypothetical protein A3H69_02425 [Candidatus Sungbacteria bacterium RIFCSPLOWO2_02_FULL_47_9]|uniref:Uncharacterized protein n=2 Tax=Parcubacteria group TaxID=1794811 RepID=A0A1G2RR01_9BACT|nr:MAG: hypothetical protein A2633_00970 [Candidatus Sungbacteria bacterium RIFCSPHIGHO2_01_FULL_47_32]OHA11181.1 MAG: hypothetical protein A3H69_02425 [Candidatus Sungbacteria bacterium RIFCSPLOWO2_02_FULL_47_9]OHA74888.1 MAG: hypothetical protein A3A32_03505 [Candidatus Wildermuthbacteria bacterium RIFCSPLOWO2_01_FULL_48_35]
MEHYICTGGCTGVSPRAGVCQAKDCPNYGKPLEKCACDDDKHHGKQEAVSEESPGAPKQ